jgi:hypothetical protein
MGRPTGFKHEMKKSEPSIRKAPAIPKPCALFRNLEGRLFMAKILALIFILYCMMRGSGASKPKIRPISLNNSNGSYYSTTEE